MDNKKLRRRNINDSEDAVATTVGTIMALLVFLSLLSLITQQYVPVWMEDNEANHMQEVKMQMSYLKGNIDNLIMNDYTDYPMYSSIKLGADGIPMFAGATPGVIRLTPDWGGLEFTIYEDGVEYYNSPLSMGNVSVRVLNRYFEQQTVVLEHGAIILEQHEGSIIRADPHFNINRHGDGSYSISLTMIDAGSSDRGSVGGSGVVGVSTELWGSTRRSFDFDENASVEFRMETAYPRAWRNWFIRSTDLTEGDISEPDEGQNLLTITIDDLNTLHLNHARINMKLST